MLRSARPLQFAPDEDDQPLFVPGGKTRRELREKLERAERLEEEVRELREKLRRTQEELRRYRACAPMLAASDRTAEAGSIPSSRVFYRRPARNLDPRPTGAQPGHPGRARERPVPNAPPLVLHLERCTECGSRLGDPFEVRRRTITDLPPAQPWIFEVEIPRYNCPGCRTRVEPECPYPPNRQYGFLLTARVVHLRLLGLSAAKVADFLEEAHGVRLSTAAVLKLESWAAEALGDLYEVLKAQVHQAPVVGADETKFRVNGENGWMWVFTHLNAVVYRIAPSRGHDVVEEVLQGSRGTLVHDGWVPYEVITTARHQLDLCHVNRWLERGEVLHRVEPRPLLRAVEAKLVGPGHPPTEFLEFADGVRSILRGSVEWSDQHPTASMDERRTFYRWMRWDMADHLQRGWRDPDAARVAGELWKRRDMLFTFLIEPGVPWHNNGAETEIRQGVLYRKLSGGRRSWTGAWVLERLLTIYRTCRKRELDFLEVVRDAISGNGYPAFGPPSVAARNVS